MQPRTSSPAEKVVKIPGPDHPISIKRNPKRVLVTLTGKVIADTNEALTLHEANYLPVQYIPRKDVEMSMLEQSEYRTYCPYKGDCSYFSIPAGGDRSVNAVWTYDSPYPAVEEIGGYLAFYPGRVDAIIEQPKD